MTEMTMKPNSEARLKAEREINSLTESEHFHPLEAIAFFRRWPRSILRNLIYTLIFNAMFAAAFTILGVVMSDKIDSFSRLARAFGNNMIISNAIGFSFWFVLSFFGPVMRRVNRRPFVVVVMAYTILGTCITSATFFLMSLLPGYRGMQVWVGTPKQLAVSFALSLCISAVLAFIWRRRVNELTGQIDLAEERERASAAERSAAEASLRALQAQIEPHFLFNTLANVTGLIHTQPDKAKQMLEQFIAYLRATLAATREHETTIGADFETMKTFLSILQIRMGDRLKVRFDLPDDLRDIAVPPMLLQPLVENAIKHGLEPKMDGGEVALIAKRVGNKIAITVADTGLGFQNSASNGIGLKNVRERVKQLYGDAGSVSIEENQPCGTRITIMFVEK
jgi:two-component sensor histidine kinase